MIIRALPRFFLALFCVSTALMGCENGDIGGTHRYHIVGTTDGPILLDRISGYTWRLVGSKWVPIAKQMTADITAPAPPISRAEPDPPFTRAELEAELERRSNSYDALRRNPDALRIINDLKAGVISREVARESLQKFVPQHLGELPLGAEDGNWPDLRRK
jgi:hypothetical protein